MKVERIQYLQELFMTYYRSGVHGNGEFGKPGSFAAGALACVGFDEWELAYGGWVMGTLNERNARMLCTFDPVKWQEMLDGLAEAHGLPTIYELVELREIELERANIAKSRKALEDREAELARKRK